MPDDERDGRPTAPSRSSAGRRSPTTRGSGPAASGRSSASSTRRCGRSAKRATTAAASTGSRSSPAARASPSTSTSPARKTCSGSSPGRSPARSSASTEALDPLTADVDGWAALRAWVARYAEIHARYEPVFHAYESDDALATVAAPHRRGDDRADPLAVGDDDAAAPPARPGHPAAARVPEPHARRRRHPPLVRPDALPERAGRGRASPTCCTARCSVRAPT